jgi:hypothetical protein
MAFCIKCGDEYPDRRLKLGYRTCLEHGEAKIDFPVVPVTKSNYIVGTISDLQHSYGAKGPRI